MFIAKVCPKWEQGKCTSQYKIATHTVNIPVIIEKKQLNVFPCRLKKTLHVSSDIDS